MKKFLSAIVIASLVLSIAGTAEAKDKGKHKGKNKKKHQVEHRDYDGNNRVRVVRSRSEWEERDRSYVTVERRDTSYRSRYPRRVVVYENRPYGYNYYDVQTVLRREGYYNGPLDGVWGPSSRRSLVRYQTDRGWRDDGEIDGRLVINLGLGY